MKIDAFMFLIDGFEEIEAITPLDILRRGGVNIASASLMGRLDVHGSHNITIKADMLFEEIDITKDMMIILPGGPGTNNYKKHDPVLELLAIHNSQGGHISAICAAPTILAMLEIVRYKTAVCHPSVESMMTSAKVLQEDVVTDGNITTSRGAGTATKFGLHILGLLKGQDVVNEVAKSIVF